MKLTVYSRLEPSSIVINVTPIEVDDRVKTVIHQTPWVQQKQFTISEITTGASIASGWTKKQARENAKIRLATKTKDQIDDAITKLLNKVSDAAEYIAFNTK